MGIQEIPVEQITITILDQGGQEELAALATKAQVIIQGQIIITITSQELGVLVVLEALINQAQEQQGLMDNQVLVAMGIQDSQEAQVTLAPPAITDNQGAAITKLEVIPLGQIIITLEEQEGLAAQEILETQELVQPIHLQIRPIQDLVELINLVQEQAPMETQVVQPTQAQVVQPTLALEVQPTQDQAAPPTQVQEAPLTQTSPE